MAEIMAMAMTDFEFETTFLNRIYSGSRFKRYNVIGDGNCMFRAFIKARNIKNLSPYAEHEDSYHELRQLVVDTALSGRYSKYFSDSRNYDPILAAQIDFQQYYNWGDKMRRDKTWGDNLVLQVLSDLYMIPITIISGNDYILQEFGKQYYSYHSITKTDNRLFLLLENHHYDVLMLN